MRNSRNIWTIIFSLVLMISVVCSACAGPFSSQERKSGKVPMPGEKDAEEPAITLYDKETEEKKEIKIEEYLKGVVAAEMETNWPDEALKAQAILARTFTLKKILDGGVEKYNTDASTDEEEFQAYDEGVINDKVKKAVEETRGITVTHNNQYINGWFHADAGGKTADSAVEGLDYRQEKAPYIQSVDDPGFEISPEENKNWKAEFPVSEVRQKIQNKTGSDPGNIESVEILEEGPSGRAVKIELGDMEISGPSLRLALGSEVMRSTLFDELEIEGDRLIAAGDGFGHGVGMSQWGAKALADQGKSAEEIIEHFFQGINIQKIWE